MRTHVVVPFLVTAAFTVVGPPEGGHYGTGRPAFAHHGDADRYNPQVITVTGTVVDLQMVNPHARIILDVDEDGKTVRWQAELGGPQQLTRTFGWTPATVKKGTKITMIGRRLKSGSPYLNLTERANIVVTDTGKEIYRTINFGEAAPEGPKGTLNSGQPAN
jgi:hypothetical protein